MLRLLKEVQSDDSIVGFYQTTSLASFFTQSLVDLQASHQERLRHGGIVVVHGTRNFLSIHVQHSQLSTTDTAQAARGNANFRAFRLSQTYLTALKKDKFSTTS